MIQRRYIDILSVPDNYKSDYISNLRNVRKRIGFLDNGNESRPCLDKWDGTALKKFIFEEPGKCLFVFGAGGAFSSALYLAHLCEQNGLHAFATTTTMICSLSDEIIKNNKFIAISSKGKNNDILSASKRILTLNPKGYGAITCYGLKTETDRFGNEVVVNRLAQLVSEKYPLARSFIYDSKIASDGFVGTRTHALLFSMIYRTFYKYNAEGTCADRDSLFYIEEPSNNISGTILEDEYAYYTNVEESKRTIIFKDIDKCMILYGNQSMAAAVDLESRLSETGLSICSLSDFGTFTHGRASCLSRMNKLALVIFETNADKDIVERLLKVIPSRIPVIIIGSSLECPVNGIELLVKSMFFSLDLAVAKNIDMQNPPREEFCKVLYQG